MDILKTAVCLLLLLLPVQAAVASVAVDHVNTNKKTKVYIGMYINRLVDLSIKDNNFSIDYYLWLRWKDSAIKPNKSLELLNGKNACQTVVNENRNGWNLVTLRCESKITKFWDLSRFPLDSQSLELMFEDNFYELGSLEYVPDVNNSNISKSFNVPGWTINNISTQISVGDYRSNFGNTTLPDKNPSMYSRYTYKINLVRRFADYGFTIKLFLPILVSMLISLLQYFVPIDNGLRLNLGVGAIFASVGASYAITSSLPPNSNLSVAELINLVTIWAIIVCLCGTVYSQYLFRLQGDIIESNKFDTRFVSITATTYVALVAIIITFR